MLVTMCTSGHYARAARRLRRQALKFHIPVHIVHVPSVHRSISPKGTLEGRTKASVILEHLSFCSAVLWVDADLDMQQPLPSSVSFTNHTSLYSWREHSLVASGGVQLWTRDNMPFLKLWDAECRLNPTRPDDQTLSSLHNKGGTKSKIKDLRFLPRRMMHLPHRPAKDAIFVHAHAITSWRDL